MIAAETRRAPYCALCRRRKEALSPAAIAGKHDSLDELPEAVVEVIHRVRTDPGRLSERWFRDVIATGLGEEEYDRSRSRRGASNYASSYVGAVTPVVGEPGKFALQPLLFSSQFNGVFCA